MKSSDRVRIEDLVRRVIVPPGKRISLSKHISPGYTGKDLRKKEAQRLLADGIAMLAKEQEKLYAQSEHALLVIFQAMDAGGKDSTIKHVMSGLNPQGCQVHSFKAPSSQELDHDYLWRCTKALPERGRIGIFNRSHYEEVLISRVHPEILRRQRLPRELRGKGIWKRRFDEINAFEQHLSNNGTAVLKFYLHISKEEQRRRFLARIDRPEKNWKFEVGDAKERAHWDEYMHAYEDVFNHTSTEWAPWHIIPADKKWFARLAVGAIILHTLLGLKLAFPKVSEQHRKSLADARKLLETEG
jgi:PPK2 family polyphosphate:nucleotide phosphotransferase